MSSFIYLMKPKGSNGVYKIGAADNVSKRIERKQKQVSYEVEIVMSVEVKNKYVTEGLLHDLFSKYRLAGEWFALPKEAVSNFKKIVSEIDHE